MTDSSSYEDIAEEYGSFYQSPLGKLYLEVTTSRIKDYITEGAPSLSILDLGCGKCSVTRRLSMDLDVTHVTAVDSSEEMTSHARRLLESSPIDDFTVRNQDIESFEATDQYDVVLAEGGVMSHLTTPLDIFEIVRDSVTDDGYGFISVITSYRYAVFSLWNGQWDQFQKIVDENELTTSDSITIQTQNTDEIRSYLTQASGIELVDIYPKVSYLGYVPVDRQDDILSNNQEEILNIELEAARHSDNDHGLQTGIVVKSS
ncbi:methyltransferase domain-containing protein [Halapricum sp. CBA1109]|uniref:class I SAM-dependent methyltransferase n=1 Tax=Halapricum sp. CBA1109 TaxID=2668068 RepID=UPI0012FAB9E7|nr:class I SAM-dependent methyltransferase [Halapricum sp. CBA1109]MUV89010.1 methyltransferase domain-containing protein [Halapricum sp. CBA1109]